MVAALLRLAHPLDVCVESVSCDAVTRLARRAATIFIAAESISMTPMSAKTCLDVGLMTCKAERGGGGGGDEQHSKKLRHLRVEESRCLSPLPGR